MNAKEFQEMPLLERAEFVNKLLLKYDEDHLKKAAEAVDMKYSAFCKEMREGGFTYSQSKKQYEKTLSLDEYKDSQTSTSASREEGNDETVRFIANHLNEIKELLDLHKTQLVLDPRVYDPESESITKSLVVHKEIYEEFTELCKSQFPHLRLKDIVSNCLYNFVKQHRKTPS